MTISTKTTIKSYFETGDFPSQSNFSDFIDSCIFGAETSAQAIATLNVTTMLSAAAGNIASLTATNAIINNTATIIGLLSASGGINTTIVSAATAAITSLTTTTQATTDSSTNAATTAYVQNNINYFVGQFTYDVSTASGTQAITGLGFKPKSLVMFSSIAGQALTASWGMATQGGRVMLLQDSNGNFQSLNTGMIYLNPSASNTATGNLSSFDSGGFTIAWTKSGTPTGTATIMYLALM